MKTKQKTTLGLPLFPSTVCTSFVSQFFGHVSALHLAMPVTALLSLTALSVIFGYFSLVSSALLWLLYFLPSKFSLVSPVPQVFYSSFSISSLPLCLNPFCCLFLISKFLSPTLGFLFSCLRVSLWSSHTLQLFAVCEAKGGRWETRSRELLLSSALTFVYSFIFLFVLAVGLAEEVSNWDSHCHFVTQSPMPAAHSEASEPCTYKCSVYGFPWTHDSDAISSTLIWRYFKKANRGS